MLLYRVLCLSRTFFYSSMNSFAVIGRVAPIATPLGMESSLDPKYGDTIVDAIAMNVFDVNELAMYLNR